MENNQPKLGDLRVWWNRGFAGGNQYFSVPNKDVACGVLFGLAMSDLENPRIHMNTGGMEVFEDTGDGEGPNWYEWYDDESGQSIDQYSEERFPNLKEMKEQCPMPCKCDDRLHERLDINCDKSDQYETIYYWICRGCGHKWEGQ